MVELRIPGREAEEGKLFLGSGYSILVLAVGVKNNSGGALEVYS